MRISQQDLRKIIKEELGKLDPRDFDPSSLDYLHAAILERLSVIDDKVKGFHPQIPDTIQYISDISELFNILADGYGEHEDPAGADFETAALDCSAAADAFVQVFQKANGDFAPHAEELSGTWSRMMDSQDAFKSKLERALEAHQGLHGYPGMADEF